MSRDASGRAPRVLVSGPASWNTLVEVPALPEPRPHMLRATRHWQALGGTSAGKSLNLAGLGAAVVLRTVLGDDDAGNRVRSALDIDGVDLLVEPAAGATEQHVNLLAQGQRLSVYLELPDPAHPAAPVHEQATQAALEACDVAVLDLAEHTRPLLAAARALGREVWCDVHDFDGTTTFHRPWVEAADVLLMNDDALPDPVPFLRSRVEAGTTLAVCTQGAAGATAVTASGTLHVPAPLVRDVVDTNGAGDAFTAGLLVARFAGADLASSMEAGHAQAARCLAVPRLAPEGRSTGSAQRVGG